MNARFNDIANDVFTPKTARAARTVRVETVEDTYQRLDYVVDHMNDLNDDELLAAVLEST